MKLNKKDTQELRDYVKGNLITSVPEGHRIHLPQNMVELLLFDTKEETIGKGCPNKEMIGKKVLVKHLVWSGPFLSRLDLSEVSFEDVLWDIHLLRYFENIEKETYAKEICLENTNANIDFSKSFEGKYWTQEINGSKIPCYTFRNVSFKNTNLSNNEIKDAELTIIDSNFENTNLKVNLNTPYKKEFHRSQLNKIKWEQENCLSEQNFLNHESNLIYFFECNLKDSSLNIQTTKTRKGIYLKFIKYAKLGKKDSLWKPEEQEYKKLGNELNPYFPVCNALLELSKQIKKGNLEGCYINGKRILSGEEKSEIRNKKIKEYEKMKQDLKDSILQAIHDSEDTLKQKKNVN